MNVQWQKLIVKVTFWLAIELWLGFLGLDDVADYSEFLWEKHLTISSLLMASLVHQRCSQSNS